MKKIIIIIALAGIYSQAQSQMYLWTDFVYVNLEQMDSTAYHIDDVLLFSIENEKSGFITIEGRYNTKFKVLNINEEGDYVLEPANKKFKLPEEYPFGTGTIDKIFLLVNSKSLFFQFIDFSQSFYAYEWEEEE